MPINKSQNAFIFLILGCLYRNLHLFFFLNGISNFFYLNRSSYRLSWMQSVIHATHYIAGAGESAYLKTGDFPDIQFIPRESIEHSDYAYIPN